MNPGEGPPDKCKKLKGTELPTDRPDCDCKLVDGQLDCKDVKPDKEVKCKKLKGSELPTDRPDCECKLVGEEISCTDKPTGPVDCGKLKLDALPEDNEYPHCVC